MRRALEGVQASNAAEAGKGVDAFDWDRIEGISADRLEVEEIPDASALYSIGTVDAGGNGRRYVFVGETLNLRERLRVQLDSAKKATFEGLPSRRFIVQYKPLGELGAVTQGHRCSLVEKLRPEWNLLSAPQ